MTAAQLINLLYNVVDRIYIGYIPEHATLSLTGLGVCLPVITAVMAFANLFGMGGAPYAPLNGGGGTRRRRRPSWNALPHGDLRILLTILGSYSGGRCFIFSGPVIPPIPMRNPT